MENFFQPFPIGDHLFSKTLILYRIILLIKIQPLKF